MAKSCPRSSAIIGPKTASSSTNSTAGGTDRGMNLLCGAAGLTPNGSGFSSGKSGKGAAGRKHDHRDSCKAEQGSDEIPPVRAETVNDHAPGKRSGDEHSAVGGEDPPEMGVR